MSDHAAAVPVPPEATDAESPTEPPLKDSINALLDAASVDWQRKLVARIIDTGIGLGHDRTTRLDLKITSAAIEEMRSAFRLFAPYAGIPKVSIFGSARTQAHDPLWVAAESVSRRLAEQGWMVVTGAGPGIMEAGTVGAGPEQSLGVSIRLPFEERPNHQIAPGDKLVSMKYFFTRKLMLVKESSGFVCLPGGFGTMDEMFELLTLQQTGKMVPVPIVLLDRPGGTFWKGLETFVSEHLEGTGMISPGDLDRVLITDSVEAAAAAITGFWNNYDSLRWSGEQLVLRLLAEPSDDEVAQLNARFAHVFGGPIARTEPLHAEVVEGDRLELPRLVLTPSPRSVGELFRLIRAVNELPSAPAIATPPTV